jgi:thiol-disulfide isomerase/thioredoxin
MTDERGECVIRNLPAGGVDLHVAYGDSYANTFAIAGDETAPRIIHLEPPAQPLTPSPPSEKVQTKQPSSGAIGQPAPELSVKEWTDGKTRSLADYKGQVVVVNFWGIEHGKCGFMMPIIKELDTRYRDRRVVFLGVHTSSTNIADVQNFLQQVPFNLLTALDSTGETTALRYGIKGAPALVVIGRDGWIEWNSSEISREAGLKNLERAARSLSIPWPIDETQPREKLFEQASRIEGVLFGEAIDQALAKPPAPRREK